MFDITGVRELPRVDVVYSYAGADSVPIDALVAAGAKGIVVAGVGRGNLAPGQGAALRRAREKGVIVVVTTRTGSGGVPVRSVATARSAPATSTRRRRACCSRSRCRGLRSG